MKIIILILVILSTVLAYTIYYRASLQVDAVDGFIKNTETGEEFFRIKSQHLSQFKKWNVTLNQTEGGAPMLVPRLSDVLITGRLSIKNGLSLSDKRLERVYVLQVILQNAELDLGEYEFENPLFDKKHSQSLDPLYSSQLIRFELTDEHLSLFRKLSVEWQDDSFAVGVDPKRPYGDATFFELDMADILGVALRKGPDELNEMELEMLERLTGLHDEMVPAMQVLLRFSQVSEGWYHRQDEYSAWQLLPEDSLVPNLTD